MVKTSGIERKMDGIRSRALEYAEIGIFRYTLDGRILFIDVGSLKILEIEHFYPEPESLIGKRLEDLFIYVKPAAIIRTEVLKHGNIRNFEYPFKTLGGKLKWSLHDSYLVIDEVTGQQAIQVIARDITKLKEAEQGLTRKNEELQEYKSELERRVESRTSELRATNQALQAEIEERKKITDQLRESEHRYKRIFTGAIDGITIIDSGTGQFLHVNPALCRMLVYTEDELLKKTVFDIHPARIINNMWEQAAGLPHEESMQFDNIICLCGDGRKIFANISGFGIELEGKHQRVGFFSDITEKKRLTEQLIHSEKMSAVGYLAAGIAHEFNNILMSSQINVDLLNMLLREEQHLSGETGQCLNNMSSSIRRGATIVRNIMEFARPRNPQKKVIPVEKIIDDVLSVYEYLFTQNQIRIIREYDAHVLLELDPGQFEQVFSNVFINAAHAINANDRGTIRIKTAVSGDTVTINITDDGIGMSTETRDKAFTPFFTTKGHREGQTDNLKGSGLGLSISHQIIEKHGGHISIDSREKDGTEVTITLPRGMLPESEDRVEYERRLTVPQHLLPLHILIIEDDESIGTQVRDVMRRLGFVNIRLVTLGMEAIACLGRDRIDAILLDLVLPDVNGLDVVEKMRDLALDIPVLCMSGQVMLLADQMQKLNNFSYLQKPFEISQLLEKLKEMFPPGPGTADIR